MSILAVLLLATGPADGLLTHVSSAKNDYNLSLDKDENRMVFARSEAEFRNARIYVAERRGNRWTEPRPISFSDQGYSDSDPWLTPDGKTLFFISDRPAPDRSEGRKDYDIWQSRLTDGEWSDPIRLGPPVNSTGQELGPELHDGILYFSSARRSGLGGLDIYRARSSGNDFEQSELLTGPFNSSASESDFTISDDGRKAMFWRSVGERGILHISYNGGSGWSPPEPLSSDLNIGPFNFTPSFGREGETVRFSSTRKRTGQADGLADIYEKALPPR